MSVVGDDRLEAGQLVVECQKCEIRAMHYQSECPTLCTDGGLHDVAATYRNYGYWCGECRRCHKVWEVDSSG